MHPVYLSRVVFNPRDRDAARILENRHLLHGVVNTAVPIRIQGAPRWLYQLDETPQRTVLLVQAPIPPEWKHLSERVAPETDDKEITSELEALLNGQTLRFALDAAPRVRRKATRTEAPLPAERRLEWLERHLAPGAEVINCRVERTKRITARSRNGGVPADHTQVQYSGLLRVTRPSPFRALLVDGIGPDKAYGNGLLRIAAADQ